MELSTLLLLGLLLTYICVVQQWIVLESGRQLKRERERDMLLLGCNIVKPNLQLFGMCGQKEIKRIFQNFKCNSLLGCYKIEDAVCFLYRNRHGGKWGIASHRDTRRYLDLQPHFEHQLESPKGKDRQNSKTGYEQSPSTTELVSRLHIGQNDTFQFQYSILLPVYFILFSPPWGLTLCMNLDNFVSLINN